MTAGGFGSGRVAAASPVRAGVVPPPGGGPQGPSAAVGPAAAPPGGGVDAPVVPPPGDGADPAAAPADAPFSLTLSDLGFALLVLVLSVVATRNVPGLVEIAILQRLPVDAAARYAIGTVIRYLIVIVGTVVAFSSIGVTWSKLQWLAAALTFGLAFGLQEIFANFISGLIILAERPVRVGDTVTVGGVSGVVTRIRMRATTITDWDRKELVIPNKTFITSDVINWTLSDPTLRIIVPVGVSYGADVDVVRSTLLDVAAKHPVVMADPRPQALFLGFGDSTLDFELRVFIPHIDHLLAVRNDMHMSVLKEFRARGIEIAFPQRDLHVRSIGDLAKLAERRDEVVEHAE